MKIIGAPKYLLFFSNFFSKISLIFVQKFEVLESNFGNNSLNYEPISTKQKVIYLFITEESNSMHKTNVTGETNEL